MSLIHTTPLLPTVATVVHVMPVYLIQRRIVPLASPVHNVCYLIGEHWPEPPFGDWAPELLDPRTDLPRPPVDALAFWHAPLAVAVAHDLQRLHADRAPLMPLGTTTSYRVHRACARVTPRLLRIVNAPLDASRDSL
jgi:hypothetical protein